MALEGLVGVRQCCVYSRGRGGLASGWQGLGGPLESGLVWAWPGVAAHLVQRVGQGLALSCVCGLCVAWAGRRVGQWGGWAGHGYGAARGLEGLGRVCRPSVQERYTWSGGSGARHVHMLEGVR